MTPWRSPWRVTPCSWWRPGYVFFIDSQRACEELELDRVEDVWVFIDVRLGKTKTANTGELVRSEKVAVGHAVVLDGVPWAKAWVDHRRELGLNVVRMDAFSLPRSWEEGFSVAG